MKGIVGIRGLVQEVADQGSDYHSKPDDHWIGSTVIATPMSEHPSYQQTRRSSGVDVLGTMLVEGALMLSTLFVNEAVPVEGDIEVSDAPGFGVELDLALTSSRPFKP